MCKLLKRIISKKNKPEFKLEFINEKINFHFLDSKTNQILLKDMKMFKGRYNGKTYWEHIKPYKIINNKYLCAKDLSPHGQVVFTKEELIKILEEMQ